MVLAQSYCLLNEVNSEARLKISIGGQVGVPHDVVGVPDVVVEVEGDGGDVDADWLQRRREDGRRLRLGGDARQRYVRAADANTVLLAVGVVETLVDRCIENNVTTQR